VGTIVVLALGGFVAARTLDLSEAVDAIRRADPLLLAAAVAVYTASWPLRGRRYGDVLAPMDRRVGTGFLTAAVLLSQTANLAIPARGGDAVRAVLLKQRRAVAYATGVASLAVERIFDLLAIAVLGGLALGWLLLAGEAAPLLDRIPALEGPTVSLPTALAVGGGLLVAIALVFVPRRQSTIASFLDVLPERIQSGIHTAIADLAVLARRPRSIAAVGAGSVVIWTLDAFTAVLVLAAVASPDPLALFAIGTLATCAGNLAKVLPLTQGGVGLYEGAFAATVVALAPIGGATALAAAVLDHAIKNAVTLAGGAIAGIALHRSSPGEPADAADSSRIGMLLGWPKK
jgi:uncharacterized membrane protein YbhN (UPF0104 family)